MFSLQAGIFLKTLSDIYVFADSVEMQRLIFMLFISSRAAFHSDA